MVFLPLIFFGILLIISVRKKGMDLGGFAILCFVVTSFFAIYLHNMPSAATLDNYNKMNPSFVPTLVYCCLIGLELQCFYRLNTNQKKAFATIKNVDFFNKITYLYIFMFFFLLVFLYKDIFNGILQGNLGDYRAEVNKGEMENAFTRQNSFVGKFIGYGAATIGAGSTYMIPFFFYSLCFTKNKMYHNILILISSLSCIILGIIDADRSSSLLWGMMFVMSFFLFRPYIDNHSRKVIKKCFFFIGGLLFVYFLSMSISRFVNSNMGVDGSILSYIGQSYLNFCNVWDNVEIIDVTTYRLFPVINKFWLNTDPETHKMIVRSSSYIRLNGFYSYIGMWFLDTGKWIMFFISLCVTLITNCVIKRVRLQKIFSFKYIMYIYMLAIIPVFGCIAYYYKNYAVVMNLFLMIYLINKIKINKIL